jgi:periplasmic protein TonB
MFTSRVLRIPFAAASGVLFSLGMFLGLWYLVSVPMDATETADIIRIDYTRQRVETPTVTKRPDKPEREPPTLTPGAPRIGEGHGEGIVGTFRPPLTKIVGPGRDGDLPMGVDRDAIPLVRINPVYPPREEAKGIEGWVRVQFTVTAVGTVRDAIVVDSEPRSVFDAAALEAIARWRYNPRVDGGVATERVGLQTLIRFQLKN